MLSQLNISLFDVLIQLKYFQLLISELELLIELTPIMLIVFFLEES